MIPPLERRLQLVTGKGGTGKTTLVAALALAHAARGRRPLVVELGHRASLARVLDVSAIEHAPREVRPGVHAANLDAREATADLVRRVLPSRVTTRALRSAPIRTFLDAAPGVVEVATLDRIRSFADDSDFDPILVDGDATGHTRMLFALHGVLAGLGVAGPIAGILDRVSGLFASPYVAAVHLTALPTALATEETLELWTELHASGRVALGHVLLDRVEGRDASTVDVAAVARAEATTAATDPALASALGLVRADRARWDRAVAARERFRALGIPSIAIDEIDGLLDVPRLRALGLGLLDEGSS